MEYALEDISHVLIAACRADNSLELFRSRQSALKRLFYGHLDLLRRRKRPRGVDDRTRRRGRVHAVRFDDVNWRQGLDDRMNLVRRRATNEAAAAGDGNVDVPWAYIGELVQRQCRFVRENGGRPERCRVVLQVLEIARWVIAEPIDAALAARKAPRLLVVSKQGTRNPDLPPSWS